jgi:hypothetical protein
MNASVVESKTNHERANVPVGHFDDTKVMVTGRWLRIASVHDEEWIDDRIGDNADAFIKTVMDHNLRADIFTFSQKLPDTTPKYAYPYEWDNVAAIPITTYEEWWEKRLPQVTRKSIRRGTKRGVFARVVQFNDDLVGGIIEIHNDTPTRQGVPFTHYGKDFAVVKREYGTYPDSSEWIAAYVGDELIGIIKLIKMRHVAAIMQIITKTKHYDKRPTNILLAKAVEVCQENAISYLIYGKFVYGNKTNSSLTEFKRRNGFERIDYPRYYVALTPKGRLAMRLKLHLGFLSILPSGLISALREVRSCYYRWVLMPLTSKGRSHAIAADVEGQDSGD